MQWKTKNNYYKAASILNFVFGALTAAMVLLFILLLASGAVFEIAYEELLAEYGEISQEFLEAYETEKLTIIILMVTTIIYSTGSFIVMFIAGARFNKFSYLTDEEANNYSGKALAWTIVSYFFGGVLIGILATTIN